MLCQVAEKRYIPKLLFIGKLSECWWGHFMLLDWRSLSPLLRACCILSTFSFAYTVCLYFLILKEIQLLSYWSSAYKSSKHYHLAIAKAFADQNFFFVAQSCWDWPGKLASLLCPRLELKTLRSLRQPKGISVFPSSGESAPVFIFLRILIRRPAGGCSIVTNMPEGWIWQVIGLEYSTALWRSVRVCKYNPLCVCVCVGVWTNVFVE